MDEKAQAERHMRKELIFAWCHWSDKTIGDGKTIAINENEILITDYNGNVFRITVEKVG